MGVSLVEVSTNRAQLSMFLVETSGNLVEWPTSEAERRSSQHPKSISPPQKAIPGIQETSFYPQFPSVAFRFILEEVMVSRGAAVKVGFAVK